MFKKIFAVVLILAFVNVQAQAPTKSLEGAFNSFTLNLGTKWDQKDMKAYDKYLEQFKSELMKIKESGVSNEALVAFAKKKMGNPDLSKEMDTMLAAAKQGSMTEPELRNYIAQNLAQNQIQGASWAGDAELVFFYVGIFLVVVLLAVAIGAAGGSGGGSSTCYDDYVCVDYYDAWGFYDYSDCYWTTVCY